jgi:tRNA threonylcarbamoyladenosine biosynthesis protein TsaE
LTVLLVGELGAGKSTFARGLIRAMGHKGPVPSPTYTLVEPYHLSSEIVYHVDLYRVASEEELRFLGWNELDDGLRLVEWPDRAPALANTADVRLTLSYDGTGRSVQIDALSAQGQELIGNIN